MGRQVNLRLRPLKTSLVNLPPILVSQLSAQSITPQSLAIELSRINPSEGSNSKEEVNNRLFVGWSGLPTTDQHDTHLPRSDGTIANFIEPIELDSSLAGEMGWQDNDRLSIKFHHGMTVAKTVHVDPVSVDDWEILESNPQYLEDHFLTQIRVLAEAQTVLVWLYGKTVIRVKVTSIETAIPNPNATTNTPYLITNETEVAVAPKPRFDAKSEETQRHQILAGEQTAEQSIKPQNDSSFDIRKHKLKLLPHQTLSKIRKEEAPDTYSTVADVSSQDFEVDADQNPIIRINPIEFRHLEAIFPSALCSLTLIPRPNQLAPVKSLHNTSSHEQEPSTSLSNSRATHSTKTNGVGHKLVDMKNRKPVSSRDILAGFDDHIEACYEYLRVSMATAELYMTVPGLLVCGSTGSGKTSLVKHVADLVHSDPETLLCQIYVDCKKHVDDRLGVLKATFNDWFDDVLWHAPSVLILDDLDSLFPAESEHVDSFRCRHWSEEFVSIARDAIDNRMVILVGTCSSSSSLHNLLTTGTHLFGETRNLKGLNKISRKEILTALVDSKTKQSDLDISSFNPLSFSSDKTEGYQPADLKDLVDRAVQQSLIRYCRERVEDRSGPVRLEDVDFEEAQSDYIPISLRDVKLQKSDVEWADIGGLHETRRILRETLEWPTKYASIFAKCPLRLRSGLLLYGYPGCGKTMLASAVAKECGLNFISIKGPELLNKYIGASEKSVRDLFDRAQVAQPCVLFFDEFDSIAPKRGNDSTGVTDRVVNQLLTQMDGAEGLEGVYVLAATSRPDLIDPALLRPGRLDQSLLCSMPNQAERYEILQAVSRKLIVDPDLQLEDIAKYTNGFTGADLQALVYAAHLAVVHEQIDSEAHHMPEANGTTDTPLEWCEILPPESAQDGIVKSRAEEEATRARVCD
ncbi:peroxisome assembly protein Pex1p [Melampsora larici-populina 98AG31]|uniref:Peroxisomal ATPase PEX1 n=1 Tax=Melampsora larici-populina (strain 98AG31 / pathotype 3-4-7) TaxID=747676 RepID=F4RHY5_MELLP|nr:peroxisome assembly protein Pex1p [Melampsora larici-populina 98AG31]EGG08049.1 peroxisome assembly protein Pex1p [Melampsora larici-populina 98AG31]